MNEKKTTGCVLVVLNEDFKMRNLEKEQLHDLNTIGEVHSSSKPAPNGLDRKKGLKGYQWRVLK